jgi:hypothetical protein
MSAAAEYRFIHAGLPHAFRISAEKDEVKTKILGRPVFRDVEIVEVRRAGANEVNSDEATRDILEHRGLVEYYEAWKAGAAGMVGEPLSSLAALLPSQEATLRAAGVHTLEQFAVVSDDVVASLGENGMALRSRAASMLAGSQDAALLASNTAMSAELADLRRQIEAMKEPKETKSGKNTQPDGKA